MLEILKSLAGDIRNPGIRYTYIAELLRAVPGHFGIALRRALLRRYFKRIGANVTIYPGARIFGAQNLTIGDRCFIGYDSTIQATGGIEIGDDVVLGPSVKIWSVVHVFERDDVPIMDQGYEYKPVVIGSGVWIAANCFVMPGARIGHHAVVAAGSVVGAKDIEPYAIVAGNPARKIGTRTERAGDAPLPAMVPLTAP